MKNTNDNIKKICNFYMSDWHFTVMLLPYINKEINMKTQIFTIFENDITQKVKTLVDKLNLKNKDQILKINWKNADINNHDIINVVGVDRGIRFVATTYDTKGKTVFYSGASINNKRKHFSSIKKELKQTGTPSARRRLKKIGRREHRWMQDVNHCISKALVKSIIKL